MANTLQELRKEAGYRTAKEFAEAADIPVPTYTRYEQDPSKIPVERAWLIADKLGCSIDAVVGREHIDVSAMRGEFQRYVDELSPDSQSLLEQIAAILKGRENFQRKTRRSEEEARYDSYLAYYERAFLQSLDAGTSLGDTVIFGTPVAKRAAFEAYLIERAAAKRTEKVEEACAPKENELWINGASIITDHGEVFCDEPEFNDIMGDILQGMREEAERKFEEQDRQEIEKIMAAYDRSHKDELASVQRGKETLRALLDRYGKEPADAHPEAVQRGKELVMSLIAEGGGAALSDIFPKTEG